MAWCLQRAGSSTCRLYVKELLVSALPSVTKINSKGNSLPKCCIFCTDHTSVTKEPTEQHTLLDNRLQEVKISHIKTDNVLKPKIDEKFASLYEGINEIHITPALPSRSFNLAPYVNESETLRCLVDLGVDLSKVEKNPDVAGYILKMDLQKDVKPYLLFLRTVGIPDDQLGQFITKNPGIFQQDLDHLQVRINYLASKKFSIDAVSRIITKAPDVLSMTTKDLDKQLGYYQKEFKLTGNPLFLSKVW